MKKSLDFNPCFYMNKKQCSYGMHPPGGDCISSLPVEILLIILSFLPLKEMVKTGILSRQWLKLWVNTPVLDFYLVAYGCNPMIGSCFVNWVNHVLQQHRGPYLKKFRICCTIMNIHREDINRWLEFALVRKVEILEINFLLSSHSSLPDHTYVSPDCWFSNGKADVDGGKSRFNLKFLKSLSLKNVNVTSEAVYFFLGNCPFLERLELAGTNRLVNLVISDPNLALKYLQVHYCPGLEFISISNFNLVSLDTHVGDLILKDLPMFVELSIFVRNISSRCILSQSATCVHQLESLKLEAISVETLTPLISDLAQLSKLKRLVINFYAKSGERLLKLLSVIKSCKHLEEFVLELFMIEPNRVLRRMTTVEGLTCSSLKLFEFKGYYGRISDVELVGNLVTNAPGLEKIIIDPCSLHLRNMHLPEDSSVREARSFAFKHMKRLREVRCLLPRVYVLIR